MTNNELRPYKENKSTNILWGGEIPAHWNVVRTKQIFSNEKKLNKFNQCNNILSLTLRGVVNNNYEKPEGLVPKDYATYQIFEKDNLVFKLIDLENYKTSRVGIVHEMGIMSPAYIRLIQQGNTNAKYFYYQYYDLYLRGVYNQLGEGVRSTLSAKDLLNMPIIVPTIDEQDQIVKYLDYQLTKINKLIRAKKKLIALLKEQRKTIINEIVTKGLIQNVKMNPSGIDYINSIPEGWSVSKIGYIGKLQNGISESGSFFTKGTPFVSYGDVYNNEQLPISVAGVANSSQKQQQVYSVKRGDIFFTRTSETIEEIGLSSVCLSDIENAVFSGFLIRFRPNNEILDPVFSKYYFKNDLVRNFFVKEMNIVIRASLGQTLLRNVPVIIPPLTEQREIGRVLDNKTAEIDKVIEKAQSEINLMTEYRNSLISEVVTGKVDVRNIVIDEFEEEISEDIEIDEDSIDEESLEVEDGDE